jgi:membrane-associated phospholipid phosphatase
MPSTAPAAQPRSATRPLDRPRPTGAVLVSLLVAFASAVGVWVLWRVFVVTYTGQRVDQVAFEGSDFGDGRLWRVAEPLLEVVSIPFVALVLLSAVLIATVRRRWDLAVQVAVLMGGANLTTQLLKHQLIERDDLGFSPWSGNTLPSGHTTAAASVSAALLFVVPPRVRPWAAILGAGYTSATGVSTMVGEWHRPSDVVAAILVVLAWSALACALTAARRPLVAFRAAGARREEMSSADLSATGALALGDRPCRGAVRVVSGMLALAGLAAALPAAFALLRIWAAPDAPATSGELLTGYIGGALGVVAVACLAFAVLLAIRELAGRAGGRTP